LARLRTVRIYTTIKRAPMALRALLFPVSK
jgi:hypothetical protein